MIALPRNNIRLEDIQAAARGAELRLSPRGYRLIAAGRKTIMKILEERQPVYGVNTGFGALADKAIPLEKITELQRNLVMSHAVGCGNPLTREEVRAAMFLRANMLSKGFSGVRCKLVEQILTMLGHDVVPVVYESGSVGASGDLAPLAHIALVIIGRGEAFVKGRRMTGARALRAAGLQPYVLQPKEGLALINGTEVMTAVGALAALRAERLLGLADLAGAATCAALGANPRVFRPDLHALKPHPGQQFVAARLGRFLRGGEFDRKRVQDAYSIRCMPQVHGAARAGVEFARRLLEAEANSVTDNPLLLGGSAVSGGNFHGAAIALGLDTMAIALTQLAAISERRIFRLLDPKLSGLPPFLAPDAGVNSGLMVVQMLAATLVTDCKLLAAPASVHSLPTSADQEDFVSMGMNSAVKARNVCDKAETVIALELLCAAQGLDLSGKRTPARLRPALRKLRVAVPVLKQDRELYTDIANIKSLLPELAG